MFMCQQIFSISALHAETLLMVLSQVNITEAGQKLTLA